MNKLISEQIIKETLEFLDKNYYAVKLYTKYDVEKALRHALEQVGEGEEIDKRVIHINATPEFMADPKNIKLINDMVEKAGSVTIKKYDPIELKNLKNPE